MVAGAVVGVFFPRFGPPEFRLFCEHLEISRQGAYTISFFGFWAVGISAFGLALWLSARPDAVPSLERRSKARVY